MGRPPVPDGWAPPRPLRTSIIRGTRPGTLDRADEQVESLFAPRYQTSRSPIHRSVWGRDVPVELFRSQGTEGVNTRGGAIALGHPLGASGARIATTHIHRMRDEGSRYGLATLCVDQDLGVAMIFESCTA